MGTAVLTQIFFIVLILALINYNLRHNGKELEKINETLAKIEAKK